jgi:hypothetical protein
MKLATVFFHTAELPHRIQYVCPLCEGDNHDILPDLIVNLSCSRCGAQLDAAEASIEIIPIKRTATVPPRLFVPPTSLDPRSTNSQ